MKAEIKERIEQVRQGIVPKGYKETKVGIIPEEWEEKRLGEMLFSSSSNISNNTLEENEGEYPIYGATGFIKGIDFYNMDKDYIAIVKDGAGAGRTLYCLGQSSVLSTLQYLTLKGKNYLKFCYYLLDTFDFSKYLVGSTIPHIYFKDYSLEKIYIPHLPEQTQIAFILTKWDSLIEEQERLIEEKQENFKVITRELLTKKRRFIEFKENWKRLKLDEFVTPTIREVTKPNEPYQALGVRSHCKGTFHKFVENPEEVGMDSLYEVKTNDLIVNITFAWEHAIAIATPKDEGRLVSHRFPTYVIKKEKIDLEFLKALIRQERLKYMLGLISPGGAGRNRVLNKKDFLKLEFNLPPLEEQQKISQLLSKLNEEILLQQEKLSLLREEKKILMQLLLTGIIRV